MKITHTTPQISPVTHEDKAKITKKNSAFSPTVFAAAPLPPNRGPLTTLKAPGKPLERPEDLQLLVIALSLKTLNYQFRQEINHIKKENKLDNSWMPIINSVKKQQDGSYQITFINRKNSQKKVFNTQSQALIKYKELTNIIYDRISPYIHVTPHGDISISKDIPSDKINDVRNSLYLIKALFKLSAENEEDKEAKEGEEAGCEGFEFYLKTQGASLKSFDNIEGIIKDVNRFTANINASSLTENLSEGLEPIERLLKGGNILLDVISIATAKNGEERAIGGVKLGFDSSIELVNLITEVASEAVAEFLGPLAVPLAGLAIGFGSLASNLIKNNEASYQTIKSLEAIINGIKSGGYHVNKNVIDPGLVAIKNINLKNKTATFGDMALYPSYDLTAGTEGVFYTENAWSFTPGSNDKGTPLSIYKAFRSDNSNTIPTDKKPIVLPYVPSTVFSYDHVIAGNWPGTNDDRATLQHIRYFYHGHFHPFVSAGGLHSIYNLKPHYKPTPVHVELDNQPRTLVVPSIADDDIRQHLSYQITSAGNHCNMVLPNKAIPITIHCQGGDKERFVFDVSSLGKANNQPGKNNIQFNGSTLTVGGQTIKFTGATPKSVSLVDHLSEHTSILLSINKNGQVNAPTVLVDGDEFQVYPNKYQLKPVKAHLQSYGLSDDTINTTSLLYTLHRYDSGGGVRDPMLPSGQNMKRLMEAVHDSPYISQIFIRRDFIKNDALVVDPKSGILSGAALNGHYGAIISAEEMSNLADHSHEHIISKPNVHFVSPYISDKRLYISAIVDKDKTENHKCIYVSTLNDNNKLQLQLAEIKVNSITMDQLLQNNKANLNDTISQAEIPETLTASNPEYNSDIDAKKYNSIDFKPTDSIIVSGSDSLGRNLALTYKDHTLSSVQGSWNDKDISYGLDAYTCIAKSNAAEIHINPRWWQGLKQSEFLVAAGAKSHDIFINTDSIPATETSFLFDAGATQPQQVHLENLKHIEQLSYAKSDSDLILFLNNKRIRLLDVIDDAGNISDKVSVMVNNQPVKISDLIKQIKVASVSVSALHRPEITLV